MEYNYRNELMHHGILGQKWGKKNGPPYPLDVSDHSTSEKKAGWRKSLKEKRFQKEIDKAKHNNPGKTHAEIANKIGSDFKKKYFTNEQIDKVLSAKERLNKAYENSIKDKELARKVQFEANELLDSDLDHYLGLAEKNFIKEIGGEKAYKEEYPNANKEMFYDEAWNIAYYEAASKYPDFKKKLDEIDAASNNYVKTCSTITDEIIKKNGNKKVIDSNYGDYGIYVNDLVYTLSEKDYI